MYINKRELSNIKQAINKLQDIIEEQSDWQNAQFPEGIHFARELANECEKHIERVYEREVRKRAKRIIKKRENEHKK